MKDKETAFYQSQCVDNLLATEDALYVLSGRWTIRVMIAIQSGYTRFNVIQRTVKGISARVLSNELKKLEENHLVERTVFSDQIPVIVEYLPTEYSHTLKEVIGALVEWGINHKRKITED
ncbi:winged helix-turn-helix transcriptional regulator [Fulvivirga ligni]|uniref:winged helix-turn-helix transcriptional regulator n=1 Tax=Fulvivirga ligni TaxID=2904246 RepID=UPI001F251013|nr:helix-turn-helix domain-containing protein [Fulvivirga ligni]UII19283.1 helix-turn-helix transcriptional regulator [Fulvivirga ligni]